MTRDNQPTMNEYFGWRYHPFADTWRIDEPYQSERDKRITSQALSLLQYGKSFAITGPSGSGKSTLIQHLIANLDPNYYLPLHIHYGGLKRGALLKAVAEQLTLETNGLAVPLLIKLQKHISSLSTGKHPVHPVIVIDDAQLLERESFMDLCSLIVCPPQKSAAASLVIVGDDMLAKHMNLAVMTPIRTRLTVNFTMEPLDEKETSQFISTRLSQAKSPDDLFEPDSLSLIAAHCHGNRREIMNVATLLINEAFYRKQKTVSADIFTGCDLIH